MENNPFLFPNLSALRDPFHTQTFDLLRSVLMDPMHGLNLMNPFSNPFINPVLSSNGMGMGDGRYNREERANINLNSQPNLNFYQNKTNIKRKANDDSDIEIIEAENNKKSGHYYRKKGEEFFKQKNFKDAIKQYTKAISINNTESSFFIKRAIAHFEMKEIQKAYEDANQALELDDKNRETHLLCGRILAEMSKNENGIEKINQAINRMTKALTLSSQNKNENKEFEKEVNRHILRAKKLKWFIEEELHQTEKIQILDDYKKTSQNSKDSKKENKNSKIEKLTALIDLNTSSKVREIPDFLCCKITMDLMEDPVITQAGFTYEKEILFNHFSKNGNTDPVTREFIDARKCYPNQAIKQATEQFLKENPWAFEYMPGETRDNIKF